MSIYNKDLSWWVFWFLIIFTIYQIKLAQKYRWSVYQFLTFVIVCLSVYCVSLYVIAKRINKTIIDVDILGLRIPTKFGEMPMWSFSHFTTHFILGYLYPNQWKIIILLGVIWEVIEIILGRFIAKFKDNILGEDWMIGNINDIFYNTIGMILGILVSQYL